MNPKTNIKTTQSPAPRVIALAKSRKLPTLREYFEARPAVDPVLVARLRGAA